MKKFTVLVAMLLCLAMSYAQEKFEKGYVDENGFVFQGYTTDSKGVPVENWAKKKVMKSSIEEESNKTSSTAEASSATAVNGFTFEQMMQFATMLQQKQLPQSNSMEDMMKMMLFLKQLQDNGTTTQAENLQIASLEKSVRKGNKISGAGLGVGIADFGVDLTGLVLQILGRGGNNSRGLTNWNQGQTRGRTDWGYGDVIRTGTNQGRTQWNNGR